MWCTPSPLLARKRWMGRGGMGGLQKLDPTLSNRQRGHSHLVLLDGDGSLHFEPHGHLITAQGLFDGMNGDANVVELHEPGGPLLARICTGKTPRQGPGFYPKCPWANSIFKGSACNHGEPRCRGSTPFGAGIGRGVGRLLLPPGSCLTDSMRNGGSPRAFPGTVLGCSLLKLVLPSRGLHAGIAR